MLKTKTKKPTQRDISFHYFVTKKYKIELLIIEQKEERKRKKRKQTEKTSEKVT